MNKPLILLAVMVSAAAVSCGGRQRPAQEGTQTVHNLILMDMSNSMSLFRNTAVASINASLSSISAAADSLPDLSQRVTIAVFNRTKLHSGVRFLVKDAPAGKVGTVTRRDYVPDGKTPLYDALASSIALLDGKVRDGDAVLVTVITDGLENASKRMTLKDIRSLVEERKARGWEFTCLGSGLSAMGEAARMGISDCIERERTKEGLLKTTKRADEKRYERYRHLVDTRKRK